MEGRGRGSPGLWAGRSSEVEERRASRSSHLSSSNSSRHPAVEVKVISIIRLVHLIEVRIFTRAADSRTSEAPTSVSALIMARSEP